MQRDGASWPMVIGFVLSIVLHLVALVPILVVLMTARQERPPLTAQFAPEHFRPEPEPELEEREQLELGIDDGIPSSLTWVGYDTYQEHLAQLADFEQAAFTDADIETTELSGGTPAPDVADAADPAANPGSVPSSTAEPSPEPMENANEPSEEPDTEPEADESTAAGEPDDPAAVGEPEPNDLAAGETGLDAPEPAALTPSAEEGDPAVPRADASVLGDAAAGAPEAEAELSSTPDPSEEAATLVQRLLEQLQRAEATSQQQRESQPSTPAPEQIQAPAVAAAVPPPEVATPGAPADREADPTSVTDVPIDKIKAGRPLAARGLELLPKRPDFTMVVQLTASPCNPLVSIHFRRDGRPSFAQILETSCDDRVDKSVLSSLYRWRAKGKPLAKLKGKETYEIRIRIVLSRR